MALKGQIAPERMGFSLPIDTPLYSRSDKRVYENLDSLRLFYRSDGAKAARMLPDVFEVDEQPRAMLCFNAFGFSHAGSYLEAVQGVECRLNGEACFYLTRLYLDSDTPIIAGREWMGAPKFAGIVRFDRDRSSPLVSATLERPAGIQLASGVMRPDEYVGDTPANVRINWGLRVVPGVADAGRPSVQELVQFKLTLSGGSMWRGVGSAHFSGASAVDPLHHLPVVEDLEAVYFRNVHYEMQLTGQTLDLREYQS